MTLDLDKIKGSEYNCLVEKMPTKIFRKLDISDERQVV